VTKKITYFNKDQLPLITETPYGFTENVLNVSELNAKVYDEVEVIMDKMVASYRETLRVPVTRRKCAYAKIYKALKVPTCGCELCNFLWDVKYNLPVYGKGLN
jgi:hypothetical protein